MHLSVDFVMAEKQALVRDIVIAVLCRLFARACRYGRALEAPFPSFNESPP